MSSTPAKQTSTTPSPQITPLHDPAHQAVIVNQQAPLGTANPNPVIPGRLTDPSIAGAGMGQKALLAKRFAKANKPSLISPTDQLQSPCTAKLSGAKQKHFQKGKPANLAASFSRVAVSEGNNKENARVQCDF